MMLDRLMRWRQVRREKRQQQKAIHHENLASILAKDQRLDEALDEVERALAVAPQSPASWYLKSKVLAGLNRTASALEALDRGRAVDPEHQDKYLLHCRKAQLLASLGRADEALDLLGVGMHVAERLRVEWDYKMRKLTSHGRAELWFVKAQLLHALGRSDEGRECRGMGEAVRDNDVEQWEQDLDELRIPRNAEERRRRRFALARLGRYREALESLEEELRRAPSDADRWGEKGWIFEKMECFHEAAVCYEKYLELGGGGERRGELADLVRCWKDPGPELPP